MVFFLASQYHEYMGLNLKISLPLVILIGMFGWLFLPNVQAAKFEQLIVRLDGNSANAPTGGTVCAETSTAGFESYVAVTFPAGFVLNTNTNNWTTNTSNLPAGASSWPGIGTASLVSGQTVTFPSNDLSANTLYCFHFSGTNTLTTSSSGNDQYGQISTGVDSSDFSLSIGANSDINVSANVLPTGNEYEISIHELNSGHTFSQNSEIEFRIDYSTTSSQPYDITLVADWSLGTVYSETVPTVDVVRYVSRSATNGYGNSVPIIDLTNRKISWQISNFSANSGVQSVRYILKTTDTYTPKLLVFFNTATRIYTAANTVTPDATISLEYLYQSGFPAAEAPQQSTSNAPAVASPPVSPPVIPLRIDSIGITNLSASNALIKINTNQQSSAELNYGTNSKKLSGKISSFDMQKEHLISIDNLSPETAYYFQVTLTDDKGKRSKSDLYTFRTPKLSVAPKVNTKSFVLTVNNLVLLNSALGGIEDSVIVPIDTPYGVNFNIERSENVPIKNVQIVVKKQQGLADWENTDERKNSVLGISTAFAADHLSTQQTNLITTAEDRYSGILKTEITPGDYEISTQISDFIGNIINTRLALIRVITPFYILDQQTSKPIERANLSLSLYNPDLKIYEPISGRNLPFSNSIFSDLSGKIFIPLSRGKYKAEIQALGYQSVEKEFEIDLQTTKNYPIFYLEEGSGNFMMVIGFYKAVLLDLLQSSYLSFKDLAASNWVFDLGAFLSLGILVLLTYLAFFYKTHFRLVHLLIPIKDSILKKGLNSKTIRGIVLDKSIHQAQNKSEVILINKDTEQVIYKTETNKAGLFMMSGGLIRPDDNYKIIIIRDGYIPFETDLSKKEGFYSCLIEKQEQVLEKVRSNFTQLLEGILNLSFELLLIVSILLELIFIAIFGMGKVMPFLAITVLNVLIWAIYLHQSLFMNNKLLSE